MARHAVIGGALIQCSRDRRGKIQPLRDRGGGTSVPAMRFLDILFSASMAALALPACFFESQNDNHGGGHTVTTGNPTDVTGTLADTYLVKGGQVTRAPDPAKVDLAALVPEQDGSLRVIPAQVKADGSFTIPGVPQGTYYLRRGGPDGRFDYLITSERSIDLGRVFLGRPDVTFATKPTPVTIDATGLSPWAETDSLWLYSAEAATSAVLHATQGAPAPGDTALHGFVYDTKALPRPALIDGSKGDSALFFQRVTRKTANGDQEYTTIENVLAPPSFTQTDGQPTHLSGAFQPVPQTNVSLDVRPGAFAALAPQVSPDATLESIGIGVYPDPGAAAGLTGAAPPVLNLSLKPDKDGVLDVSYGNPYPASWKLVIRANGFFSTKLALPGQSEAKPSFGWVDTSVYVDDLATGPVAPRIGPAQKVQINGKDASGALAGVGSPVKLSWSAPALGTAAHYVILLERQDRPRPLARTWSPPSTRLAPSSPFRTA
jgi:hypothetical protein